MDCMDKLRNPFKELHLWIKGEILDIEAILNAVRGRNKIEKIRDKIISKQNSDKSELDSIQAGRKTMRSVFKTQNAKNTHCLNLEQAIENSLTELESYNEILELLNFNFTENIMPTFKK